MGQSVDGQRQFAAGNYRSEVFDRFAVHGDLIVYALVDGNRYAVHFDFGKRNGDGGIFVHYISAAVFNGSTVYGKRLYEIVFARRSRDGQFGAGLYLVFTGVEGRFAVHYREGSVLYGLGHGYGVHRGGLNRAAFGQGRSSFGKGLNRGIATVAAQLGVGEVIEYSLGVGMSRAGSLVGKRTGCSALDFVEVVPGSQTRDALRIVVVGLGYFVGRKSFVIELHLVAETRETGAAYIEDTGVIAK